VTTNDDITRESDNVDTNVEEIKENSEEHQESSSDKAEAPTSDSPSENELEDQVTEASSKTDERSDLPSEARTESSEEISEADSEESSEESSEADSEESSEADSEADSEEDDDVCGIDLLDEGFTEEELPPEFERFVTSLTTNDDDEIEGLEPPASDSDITTAEKRLSFTFPEDFRNFLGYWNGGSVHEVCVYGVGSEDEFDIVEFNKRSHSEDFPKEFIAFASTVVGDIFCFQRDWGEEDEQESPVFLYDAENGTAVETAESFLSWLEHLPSLEHDITDTQQPQPMTVDEWETFLTRERAKLRMLSKTPAKDLSMPDPDAIRAELKNKIPVDPRHLKPKT
jgi:hypothetical protein